jgi:hypothetical protein
LSISGRPISSIHGHRGAGDPANTQPRVRYYQTAGLDASQRLEESHLNQGSAGLFVISAHAGIRVLKTMDPGMRRDMTIKELNRATWNYGLKPIGSFGEVIREYPQDPGE